MSTASWLVLASCSGTPSEPRGTAGTTASAGSSTGGSAALGAGAGGAPTAVGGSSATAGSPPLTAGASGSSAGSTSTSAGNGNGGTNASGGSAGSPSAGTAGMAGGGAGGPPIVDLFNGTDLTGFQAYREPLTMLSGAQALEIFKVENGTIRVYGDKPATETQARHTLVTTKSYSKYKFWLEYKWGTKTYPPYANTAMYPRDAGVLFHLHGGTTRVWPPSAEFQIKDGSTGDIFALLAKMTSTGQGAVFTEGGAQVTIDGSGGNARHARLANVDFELPDWNQILLEVNGGTATYTVNGKLANKVLAVTSTAGQAVTSGPLALQAEHAEVFYRNIRIQELP
ncbi:MAG TPA: DUF1080 domain-containing protein [Polyangiaceae bacterium]|nr:DUF1080 domain-containing protein [Polyangiaceae bacterium]